MVVAIWWIQFDGEVRLTCSREMVSGCSEGKAGGLSSIVVSAASVRKEEGLLPDQSSHSISRLIPGCTSKSSSLSALYTSLLY